MNALNPTAWTPARRPLRLFAAGLVLAMAGSVALTAFAQPVPPAPAAERGMGHHGHGHHGHHGGPGGPGMGWLGGRGLDRMLDSVKATDAQRTEIRRIADAARSDLRAQHESGRALRGQALDLFAQPTVDANAAEALRQQTLQQHDAASRRMVQAMLEVSRVLTPEQRQQLVQRMKQRQERMAERHGRDRAPGAPATGAMPATPR
ncbi:Spy/CpxP family protein refolding chaperone [Aquabacterium sp. J223]|uniref:Spy/CpxP family protein refolding chaperone n=1 Tax=Aquabacterium sp. J223 TaxID=2898431 RepID=UPI0021ADB883|nr:Spy/CpxP family protein refolding chaperone [Aquabacterium sp. J223]UUX94957.1 Spy/CpxP family protein refolding chaperone [Aquabacterium sp. J223]